MESLNDIKRLHNVEDFAKMISLIITRAFASIKLCCIEGLKISQRSTDNGCVITFCVNVDVVTGAWQPNYLTILSCKFER